MVDVQQQSGDFKSGEVASSADGLGCDVFNCFACVETDDLIFSLLEAFDQTFDRDWVQVPHRVCLFIIELGRSIKHKLSKRSNSFPSDFLVLVSDDLSQQLSQTPLSYFVANHCGVSH